MLDPIHPVEDPARDLRRVLDRAGGLPLAHWDRVGESGLTLADAFRAAGQELADLAARAQGQPVREVPRLRLHGLPDQLAVLARDALAVTDEAGRARVGDLLVGLRRRL